MIPTTVRALIIACGLAAVAVTADAQMLLERPPAVTALTRVAPPAPACDAAQTAMDAAITAYQSALKDAADTAAAREERGIHDEPTPHPTGEFEVTWQIRSMDIPSVEMTMRSRDFIFRSPQVTMRQRTISFDFVGTRMVPRVVGKYPEFRCSLSGCKVTWKDIITNVPEVFRERKSFSTDIPEIAMRETRPVLSVPDTRVVMRRIETKVPQFKLIAADLDGSQARKDAEAAAAHSQERIQSALSSAQAEAGAAVVGPVNQFFACTRDGISEQRNVLSTVYTTTVAQIEATLVLMESQGAGATPEATEMRQRVATIRSEAAGQIQALDAQIVALTADEARIIAQFTQRAPAGTPAT